MFKSIFIGKISLINKFKNLFKPPGCKHDGTEILPDDLREEWLKNQ